MTDKTSIPLHFVLLVPCYNNEAGLIKSLRSVHYDKTKYLILVVDDGSTDSLNRSRITAQLEPGQPVELLTLEKNAGITNALNIGLSWIYKNVSCRYVARVDCGDTCHAQRFYRQVRAMDDDPQLLLLGTWCRFVQQDGKSYLYKTATRQRAIKRGMFFRNLFIHPTFMMRLLPPDDCLRYSTAYHHAEDYALAWRLMNKGRVSILPDVLVNCEINDAGISETNRRAQLRARQKVVDDFAVNNILKIAAKIYLFLLRIIPRRLILAYKLRKQ